MIMREKRWMEGAEIADCEEEADAETDGLL
jgi:hypothetical protein